MSAARTSVRTPVALGFRAVRGGCAVVGVAIEDAKLRVVLSSFLATATADDRLALEPYRVAAAMRHGTVADTFAEATSAVAEGRKRQDRLATDGLAALVGALRDAGCEPIAAALLVNRAGHNTLLGGNIGKPLINEAVEAKPEDCVIAEVSSFQLESIRSFKELCDGKWDHLPVSAFRYVGVIEQAEEQAKKMAR